METWERLKKAEKVNSGRITTYPFKIPDKIDTAETHRQNSIKVYAVASSNITVMQNNDPVNKKTPEAYKMNILVRHRLFTRPSGYSVKHLPFWISNCP